MTSTSTFKGMDSESKPSSRVLAPPGGGSSNIFGLAQPEVKPAPQKKEPEPAAPAPKPAAAAEAAAAQPTASPATDSGPVRSIRSAPKQGEDSFQNLFGSVKPDAQISNVSKNDGKSDSTFSNLFGQAETNGGRKISGSNRQNLNNSFQKLFGDEKEKECLKANISDGELNVKSLSLHNSPNSSRSQNQDYVDKSFHRVFGEFPGDSTPTRSKRQTDSYSAFNPITGEPYETADSKQKKEEPSSTSASKEDNSKEGKENGQQAAAQKPKPSSVDNTDRTCTRIAQPPGGKSSGLW